MTALLSTLLSFIKIFHEPLDECYSNETFQKELPDVYLQVTFAVNQIQDGCPAQLTLGNK